MGQTLSAGFQLEPESRFGLEEALNSSQVITAFWALNREVSVSFPGNTHFKNRTFVCG